MKGSDERTNDFKNQSDYLISEMKRNGFLVSKNVEMAIRNTPRHEFVPDKMKDRAYYDIPLPIFKDQTISQPSVVARMIEWLDVKAHQKVLEIGTGSGWQAGILSNLVSDGRVFSIERHAELVKFAKDNLDRCHIGNVEVILGDGSKGLPGKAPFDRIIISAACKKIPSTLLEQLDSDGLLIAPVGDDMQSLILMQKKQEKIIEIKNQPGYVFVPLLNDI